LTQNIMDKVGRFEKKRITFWLIRFILILLFLTGAFIFVFSTTLRIFDERKIWDLLSLFGEEREIIADFWQDTLFILWEELPRIWLVLWFGILAVIIIFIIANRKKIYIIRKKIQYFRKGPPPLTSLRGLHPRKQGAFRTGLKSSKFVNTY